MKALVSLGDSWKLADNGRVGEQWPNRPHLSNRMTQRAQHNGVLATKCMVRVTKTDPKRMDVVIKDEEWTAPPRQLDHDMLQTMIDQDTKKRERLKVGNQGC